MASPRTFAVLALLAAAAALAGCKSTYDQARRAFAESGLADRCVDVMERAFIGARIKVTGQDTVFAPEGGGRIVVVRIQGVREKVPAGHFLARDVAVECRFENEVLTAFHWTTGPFQ